MSSVHRAYAGHINARRKKTGHFWQGRFGCVAMDNNHALSALRYVLLNPVRAKLCTKAAQWLWSSAKAYLKNRDDGFTETDDMRALCPDIKSLLADSPEQDMAEMLLRRAETIGRPLGSAAFLEKLERKLGRPLKPAKRGPKPAAKRS
jgi:putative transposase